jgi:hypothetical protein
MKNIFLLISLVMTQTSFGQDSYQTFSKAGFKIKCPCTLRVNSTFIEMAKGQKTVIGAYLCAENEDNPEYGVINNINVYDEDSYSKISPSDYAYFEKQFLKEYAKQLTSNGMTYNYVTYKGVSAIEYEFDQMGLPTKAIMFLKNKRSYLIQVASRHDLTTKFDSLKTSFEFL